MHLLSLALIETKRQKKLQIEKIWWPKMARKGAIKNNIQERVRGNAKKGKRIKPEDPCGMEKSNVFLSRT